MVLSSLVQAVFGKRGPVARVVPPEPAGPLLGRFTQRTTGKRREHVDVDGAVVDVEFIHVVDADADAAVAIARFEAALPPPFARVLACGQVQHGLFALITEADRGDLFAHCRRLQPPVAVAVRMAQVCLLAADLLEDARESASDARLQRGVSLVVDAALGPVPSSSSALPGVVLRRPLARPDEVRGGAGVLRPKFAHLLSPEMIRGTPTSSTHQFAVAVGLLTWLAGQRPFEAESDFSSLELVRNVDLDPPLSTRVGLPALAAVLARMLAREPGERFAAAAAARAALQPFAGDDDDVARWITRTTSR